MLKQLRFKNWRSLRDVTIDLSPITVFIGANSSGKTNIVDALKFRRDINMRDLLDVVQDMGREKIISQNTIDDETLHLGFFFQETGYEFGEVLKLKIDQSFPHPVSLKYAREYFWDNIIVNSQPFIEMPSYQNYPDINISSSQNDKNLVETIANLLSRQYRYRWQILGENLSIKLKIPQDEIGNRYIMDLDGGNLLFILEMLQRHPDKENFEALIEDVSWLMPHVKGLQVYRPIHGTHTVLRISSAEFIPEYTVSAGTQRLLTMLATIYALNVPYDIRRFDEFTHGSIIPPALPGLIVIEEPDAALNPGVLQKFVELLRRYVDNPDGTRPRQIILTTHNPTFLNYFKPEEVRVVERGEDGYTTVSHVPDFVKENWLDEYALGEVWLTNLFGGTNS